MLNPVNSILKSKNRNGGGFEFGLSDGIAVEILSRLPATDVVRLRSVCKGWRDLISSHYFTRSHLQRSRPMLFHEESPWTYDLCLLDQWWEPAQTAPKTYKISISYAFEILFSSSGLLVMQHYRGYRIFNPIYHESVEITLSEELQCSEIDGVFFHPSLKEYCTLWRIPVSRNLSKPSVESKQHEYKILTLGSEPCWRDINNPWSHGARIRSIPPVLIDEDLYWVVKLKPEPGIRKRIQLDMSTCIYRRSFSADIMEFDIRTEEFTFIPSPVPGTLECHEWNTNLLDVGGLLSLVHISGEGYSPSIQSVEVNIWTLKDRASQLWTRSTYSIDMDACSMFGRPIAIVNDELIASTRREQIIYNFKIYLDKRGEVGKNRKRSRWEMPDGVDENPVTISK